MPQLVMLSKLKLNGSMRPMRSSKTNTLKSCPLHFIFIFLILLLLLLFFYFTILYWYCHTSTCIRHGCSRVPHPEPPSHLPPHTIPLGHPSAPAPSTLPHASNLDWRFISHMIVYMFQCHSPILSHPRPLPQSPKGCSIHLCLLLSHIQGYHYSFSP